MGETEFDKTIYKQISTPLPPIPLITVATAMRNSTKNVGPLSARNPIFTNKAVAAMASRARQDSGLIRWRLKPSNRPLWWLIQWKEGLAGPPELEKDENEWEKRKILESYRVVLIVGLPPKLASFWIISSQNSSNFYSSLIVKKNKKETVAQDTCANGVSLT